MNHYNLVLLGPPGSGKGTLCADLSADLGIIHISTGAMLREAVKKESPLGKKAGEYMRTGQLVPDEIMMGIVEERLKQPDCKKGFLLDGYPRTIPQAEALDQNGPKIDAVISLEVDEELCVNRLANRRTCSKCGLNYNLITQPPKQSDHCDVCGAKLILRDDDRPVTVKERFKVYLQLTEPLTAYYIDSNRILTTDGTLNRKKVLENVKNMLQYKIYSGT